MLRFNRRKPSKNDTTEQNRSEAAIDRELELHVPSADREASEDQIASAFQVQERSQSAKIALMHQLAIAIIMRDHLPPSAATELLTQLPNVSTCTLSLMAESGVTPMLPIPLIERGNAVSGPLTVRRSSLTKRSTSLPPLASSSSPPTTLRTGTTAGIGGINTHHNASAPSMGGIASIDRTTSNISQLYNNNNITTTTDQEGGGDGDGGGGGVGRGTAAWTVASSGAPLHCNSHDLFFTEPSCKKDYSDWQGIVASDSRVKAVVTAAVRQPGCMSVGAITFGLTQEDTSEEERSHLELFASCLSSALSHESKFVCETSLGYLSRVMPPAVIQAMVRHPLASAAMFGGIAGGIGISTGIGNHTSSTTIRPQSSTSTSTAHTRTSSTSSIVQQAPPPSSSLPRPPAAAAAAVGLLRCVSEPPAFAPNITIPIPSSVRVSIKPPVLPLGPVDQQASTSRTTTTSIPTPPPPTPSTTTQQQEQQLIDSSGYGDTSTDSDTPFSTTTNGTISMPRRNTNNTTTTTTKRKNSSDSSSRPPPDPNRTTFYLTFKDPTKERRFQRWWKQTQLNLDIKMFRLNAALMLLLFIALVVKSSMCLGAVVVALQCMTGLIMPALFHNNAAVYPRYRNGLIVGCRLCTGVLLLLHWCLHPEFYARSFVKALTARSVPRLLSAAVHNRLQLAVHSAAVLAELYLAATAASFIYTSKAGAELQYMGLGLTLLTQAVAAGASIGLSYWIESRARRQYLSSFSNVSTSAAAPSLSSASRAE